MGPKPRRRLAALGGHGVNLQSEKVPTPSLFYRVISRDFPRNFSFVTIARGHLRGKAETVLFWHGIRNMMEQKTLALFLCTLGGSDTSLTKPNRSSLFVIRLGLLFSSLSNLRLF